MTADYHFDPAELVSLDAVALGADMGMVFYTDGGSDLQAGLGGWGLHGYSYRIEEPSKDKFSKIKDAPSTLGYADGREQKYDSVNGTSRLMPGKIKTNKGLFAFPGNPQSYPVTIDHLVEVHGSIDKGTVNACELTAMVRTFELIILTKPVQVAILADSEYTLKCILGYCRAWSQNGWRLKDGNPVKNLALVQRLWGLYNEILESGTTRLEFAHVYSHTGEHGNDAADALATRGKIRCRKLQRITDSHSRDVEFASSVMSVRAMREVKAEAKVRVPSRLIEQRFWYGLCNRGAQDWGPVLAPYHVYLLGDHGKLTEPEMIGVEVATSKIAAFIAREPEPVFDGLQKMLHEEYYDAVSRVTLGLLPNIMKKDRYAKLTTDLQDMVFPEGDDKLQSDDKALLLEKMTPAWNGYRLVDELERLVRLGEEFLVSPETLVLTDVTDQILERVEKGKKIEWKPRSCINPPNRTVKLHVRTKLKGAEYDDVICKLDTDLPSRNTLAAIAGEDTKVYIVTIRTSGSSYLYYGMVHCPEGLLVTAALTANHVFRKGPAA